MLQVYRSHLGVVFSAVFLALMVVGCEKKLDSTVEHDTPSGPTGTISDASRLATLDTLTSVFGRMPGVGPGYGICSNSFQ
jgi:hypothetical protein